MIRNHRTADRTASLPTAVGRLADIGPGPGFTPTRRGSCDAP
ncbi:hypothetical protein [Micromonospora sp. SH-82]